MKITTFHIVGNFFEFFNSNISKNSKKKPNSFLHNNQRSQMEQFDEKPKDQNLVGLSL